MSLRDDAEHLTVLLIGAGVVGRIYAGQLALGGCRVWVLKHSKREQEFVRTGIRLQDIEATTVITAAVNIARTPVEREYDVVLVAVQAEQLPSTFATLQNLTGSPHIIFLGNNPAGRALIPRHLPGNYELAFPGVAGTMQGDTVQYIHISQQPTTFETSNHPLSTLVQSILESRGFPITRTAHMDGWLAYHALFIACMLAALRVADNDPGALSRNRPLLGLLCRAIEQGFAALKAQHVPGPPRALAILHLPILRPVAVHYWRNVMRSGRGELYFAAHARHAPQEAHLLRLWALEQIKTSKAKVDRLRTLLDIP